MGTLKPDIAERENGASESAQMKKRVWSRGSVAVCLPLSTCMIPVTHTLSTTSAGGPAARTKDPGVQIGEGT